jgi:hypothetical protein
LAISYALQLLGVLLEHLVVFSDIPGVDEKDRGKQ